MKRGFPPLNPLGSHMTLRPRHRKILLSVAIFLLLAFIGLTALIQQRTSLYAINEAKRQALNTLLVHRATHAYVMQIQRPEIYRLQNERKLYKDYFSPKVMSFTYISRNIKDKLNLERDKFGLPPIYFKLASKNPRNPINQADPLEADLLNRMNQGKINEFQDVAEIDGHPWLYLAVPIERSTPGCMKCHGDPKDAPRELVAMYGDQAGFHESPNDIRALISIRVPLQGILDEARKVTLILSIGTLTALSGIFALVAYFLGRLSTQEGIILQQNAELASLSVTDPLTGILNRLGISQRLNEQLSLAGRTQHTFSLLLLDLDHFKSVNDQYGHAMGDAILKRFTRLIKTRLRASDIFGRWGGEEFLVIVPNAHLAEAQSLAEKLRAAIEAGSFEADLRLTVSIGVTEYREGEKEGSLLERVDQALYQAKHDGRNLVIGF